ncbi:antitoxin Xre/MbcA/ParS toxin-binding domain-containing protein [Stappia sp. ES.058]|uniref:antitoxin Xre/MbcA/ParS toxin-binding domain-containing protein n=1 Tax=Stappia sp. ES.058 TaxID=1881061 RepID=UPI00087DA481|nr:antitoxin Xre/MbcA/ParS toxin-binding domain-containing protein [Stappia sp. ES.058]SDT98156.1 putative toxin-antitoxin system antitoxin component, TIGR02293 family [Stappia sp. ES.058]
MSSAQSNAQPASLIAELESLHRKAETLAISSPVDFHVERRLLDVLSLMGVADAEIDRVVFPGGRPEKIETAVQLSPEHSDRACRFARVVKFAEQVFGNHQKAFLWLRSPSKPLMGRSPIECIGTETGASAVEELLSRIDFGLAA